MSVVRCLLLQAVVALLSLSPIQAASVFWSFESVPAGTGAASSAITYNSGFPAAPSFSQFNGTGGSTSSVGTGGASSFTYSENGVTYLGSGNGNAPGHSLLWGTSASTSYFNGAGFTLSLSTVGLTDLGMRFDIRAATGDSNIARPPASFSAIEYSLDGGSLWNSTGVTSPIWANGSGTPFSEQTINLSSVDAIENQSNLRLRFTFATSAIPGSNVTQNVRIDNLVIDAVPEPSTAALLGIGVVTFLLRRRPMKPA